MNATKIEAIYADIQKKDNEIHKKREEIYRCSMKISEDEQKLVYKMRDELENKRNAYYDWSSGDKYHEWTNRMTEKGRQLGEQIEKLRNEDLFHPGISILEVWICLTPIHHGIETNKLVSRWKVAYMMRKSK